MPSRTAGAGADASLGSPLLAEIELVHRSGPVHNGCAMKTWFTSDLHFGHANVIGYSSRPFADVEEMNEALVNPLERTGRRWRHGVGARRRRHGTARRHVAARRIAQRQEVPPHRHRQPRPLLARASQGRGDLDAALPRCRVLQILHGAIDLDIGGTSVLACHFPTEATATTRTAISKPGRRTTAGGSSTAMSTSAGESVAG